jgi:mycothiol synthase
MTMQSFQLRAFTPADSLEVVDLINAESARTVGFPRAMVDAVGNIRHHRYVPLNSEKVVAVDAQNRVIGYAYLADRDSSVVLETGGAVHPDHWGRGIGQALLAWAEEQARILSEQAPAGVRTVLQVNLFENEPTAIQRFADSGYSKVREWTHMELLMDAAPAIPSLADDFILREMDVDNDWDIVGPAMDDAFADHWGTIPAGEIALAEEEDDQDDSDGDDEPSDDSFSNAPGYCFIVLEGDTVAGGVLCNAKLVERNDTGRVGSVFVRGAYRRRKIGQALMQTAFQAFWEKGIQRIILDTDSESFSQSRVFYSGLGMKPYRREFLYEKEICPGREVRRLEK